MSNYFKRLPDFEYVSRLPDARISDYIKVKNLFKKGALRQDIFQNTMFFTKYDIKGDDRPDNVAQEIYDDPTLDWAILAANNIINIQSEWPLPQNVFDSHLLEKYGDYDTLYNGVHHYVTTEVKDSSGTIMMPAGVRVSSPFSFTYHDLTIDDSPLEAIPEGEIATPRDGFVIDTGNIAVPVTNYEYEEELENKKRNIYILKPEYLNIIADDLEEMMTYKKGSTQYRSETLKRADNIRLYE